jgi:DNA-binding transcriptional MerR regulator
VGRHESQGEPKSVDKAPDAFRTISEVAEDLDLPQHVLRFWETRFNQIRPMKRGGGRRYYRPDDVELLRGIRHLLYGEGYTIKGVQRILKEQGVRFVMEIWRNPGTPIPNGRGASVAPPARAAASSGTGRQDKVEAQYASSHYDEPTDDHDKDYAAQTAPGVHAIQPDGASADDPLPAGILAEGAPGRSGLRFMDRLRGSSDAAGHGSLSRDDVRRLQATLFELLECKRLLDQTR